MHQICDWEFIGLGICEIPPPGERLICACFETDTCWEKLSELLSCEIRTELDKKEWLKSKLVNLLKVLLILSFNFDIRLMLVAVKLLYIVEASEISTI